MRLHVIGNLMEHAISDLIEERPQEMRLTLPSNNISKCVTRFIKLKTKPHHY